MYVYNGFAQLIIKKGGFLSFRSVLLWYALSQSFGCSGPPAGKPAGDRISPGHIRKSDSRVLSATEQNVLFCRELNEMDTLIIRGSDTFRIRHHITGKFFTADYREFLCLERNGRVVVKDKAWVHVRFRLFSLTRGVRDSPYVLSYLKSGMGNGDTLKYSLFNDKISCFQFVSIPTPVGVPDFTRSGFICSGLATDDNLWRREKTRINNGIDLYVDSVRKSRRY